VVRFMDCGCFQDALPPSVSMKYALYFIVFYMRSLSNRRSIINQNWSSLMNRVLQKEHIAKLVTTIQSIGTVETIQKQTG
jgi:uncharacterized protein (UPF0128 family)